MAKLLGGYVPRLKHRMRGVYCGVVGELLGIGKRTDGGGGGEGGSEEEVGEWAEVVARLVVCRA